MVPQYDIFSGTPEKGAIWVQTVAGLPAANDRMLQIASEKPGRYFVFDTPNHTVMSRIDTIPSDLGNRSERASA